MAPGEAVAYDIEGETRRKKPGDECPENKLCADKDDEPVFGLRQTAGVTRSFLELFRGCGRLGHLRRINQPGRLAHACIGCRRAPVRPLLRRILRRRFLRRMRRIALRSIRLRFARRFRVRSCPTSGPAGTRRRSAIGSVHAVGRLAMRALARWSPRSARTAHAAPWWSGIRSSTATWRRTVYAFTRRATRTVHTTTIRSCSIVRLFGTWGSATIGSGRIRPRAVGAFARWTARTVHFATGCSSVRS